MATNADNETGPVCWVFEEEALGELTEAIRGAEHVVMDLETTGLDEHATTGGFSNGGVAARVALAAFTIPQATSPLDRRWDGQTPVSYALPLSHPDSPFRTTWRATFRKLMREMAELQIPLSNQNVKFDARWSNATTGVDLSELIEWDTQDAQRIMDENVSARLKVAVPDLFGIPPWNDFKLDYPGAAEQVPLIDLGAYAVRDTWWTWRWEQYQRDALYLSDATRSEEPVTPEERQDARLGKLAVWVSMPTVASLTKVEQRGLRLDVGWTKATLEHDRAMKAEATERLIQEGKRLGVQSSGFSMHATSNYFKEFTTRAVEADELRVLTTTANLAPQWNKFNLAKNIRMGYEVATPIASWRLASKRSEFLVSWLEKVSEEGFIHSTYNTGLATGRLSSSNPNLQQVTKKLRPAFIPRDGYVIADFDFSQIELRAAAFIWRIEPMLQAYREDADLHRRMAAVVNGVPEEEVTAESRQQAKAANFGLLYGMSANSFQSYAENTYGVVLTDQEAVNLRDAFFNTWEGMADAHERTKWKARRDGFITSPLGRVRRLPSIWDGNEHLSSHAERQALNAPIQGFASDLLQIAMASIQGVMPKEAGLPKIEGAYPVATVHDSIVVELEEDNWEELAQAVQYRMTHLDSVLTRLGVDLDVPLKADYSVGTRWSWSDVSDPQPTTPSAPLAEQAGEAGSSLDLDEDF